MLLQQIINGVIVGSTYALIGVGLTLIFGAARIPNFAHGEAYMIGAFLSYFLVANYHWPFILAMVVAAATVGLFGILVEKVAFRPLRNAPELAMLISSLAVVFIIENGAMLLWGEQPRAIPLDYSGQIQILNAVISTDRLILIIIAIIAIVGLQLFINKTNTGKAMRAMAQDREAARLMGINIDRLSTVIFAVGSALASLAGSLLGIIFPIQATMGAMAALKAFIVIILAGIGSIGGTIISGLILGISENLGAGYLSSAYKDTFAFVLLILILLFKPEGLFARRVERD